MTTDWKLTRLVRMPDGQQLTAWYESEGQFTVKLSMVNINGILECEHLEISRPVLSTNDLRRIPLGWMRARAVNG